MKTFTWAPSPSDAGVMFYSLEHSTDGGRNFAQILKVPNRQDDARYFDFSDQTFKVALSEQQIAPGDVLRIAAVSDVPGPYSYFYVPAPPPPSVVPVLELAKPRSPYSTAASSLTHTSRNGFAGAAGAPTKKKSDLPLLVVGLGLVFFLSR